MDAAITEYRRAIAMQPGFTAAHLSLGQALGDAGKLDAAIAEFQEVLRLQPDHAEARRNLEMALALKREGRR
jgi:tetratricopeptide (TPR) repeat protein